MVLYFDVFRHPLTEPELTRLLCPGDHAAVAGACDHLMAQGLLEGEGGWRHRPGAAPGGAEAPQAMGLALGARGAPPRRLPWVGLMVTGSLSKNSAVPTVISTSWSSCVRDGSGPEDAVAGHAEDAAPPCARALPRQLRQADGWRSTTRTSSPRSNSPRPYRLLAGLPAWLSWKRTTGPGSSCLDWTGRLRVRLRCRRMTSRVRVRLRRVGASRRPPCGPSTGTGTGSTTGWTQESGRSGSSAVQTSRPIICMTSRAMCSVRSRIGTVRPESTGRSPGAPCLRGCAWGRSDGPAPGRDGRAARPVGHRGRRGTRGRGTGSATRCAGLCRDRVPPTSLQQTGPGNPRASASWTSIPCTPSMPGIRPHRIGRSPCSAVGRHRPRHATARLFSEEPPWMGSWPRSMDSTGNARSGAGWHAPCFGRGGVRRRGQTRPSWSARISRSPFASLRPGDHGRPNGVDPLHPSLRRRRRRPSRDSAAAGWFLTGPTGCRVLPQEQSAARDRRARRGGARRSGQARLRGRD